jgi:hypothetical protein
MEGIASLGTLDPQHAKADAGASEFTDENGGGPGVRTEIETETGESCVRGADGDL